MQPKPANGEPMALLGSLRAVFPAEMGHFLDVMHQAVEQPLHGDFGLAAIGEPVEPLLLRRLPKTGSTMASRRA